MNLSDKNVENVVGISKKEYDEMIKECRNKGHTFTYDKYNKRTLVKMYEGEMYEYVKGKRDRRIKSVTKDVFLTGDSTSLFGGLIQHFLQQGEKLEDAINMARVVYSRMQ